MTVAYLRVVTNRKHTCNCIFEHVSLDYLSNRQHNEIAQKIATCLTLKSLMSTLFSGVELIHVFYVTSVIP
jgi:hypothetical protein